MDLGLAGKVVVITGGGRGIGAKIAEYFAKENAVLVIADINFENAQQIKEKLQENGGNAIAVKVDISSKEEIDSVVQLVLEKYGQIDVWVNNASVVSLLPMNGIDGKEWDRLMNINLKGTFYCCQSVIPHMIKQKSGAVINLAGIAGIDGGVVAPHYSISKAGVICMTKCFAKYAGIHNVRVNTISPGPVETDMTKNWPETLVKTRLALTPMGKFAKPDDVAAAVVFLASNKAGHITGENMIVDGGNLMD